MNFNENTIKLCFPATVNQLYFGESSSLTNSNFLFINLPEIYVMNTEGIGDYD